jgi:arsenate reductase-like glutaredoxin family protein
MADVLIFHNPHCNSSRNAVAIAEEIGVDFDVVLYLETPPDAEALRSIVAKLEDPVNRRRHSLSIIPMHEVGTDEAWLRARRS